MKGRGRPGDGDHTPLCLPPAFPAPSIWPHSPPPSRMPPAVAKSQSHCPEPWGSAWTSPPRILTRLHLVLSILRPGCSSATKNFSPSAPATPPQSLLHFSVTPSDSSQTQQLRLAASSALEHVLLRSPSFPRRLRSSLGLLLGCAAPDPHPMLQTRTHAVDTCIYDVCLFMLGVHLLWRRCVYHLHVTPPPTPATSISLLSAEAP